MLSREYPRWFPQDQRRQGLSRVLHQPTERLHNENGSDTEVGLGSRGYHTQTSSDPNKHPTGDRTDSDASLPPKRSSIGLLFPCGIRFFLCFLEHIIGVPQRVNDRTLVYSPDAREVRPRTSGVTLSFGDVDEDDCSEDLVQFRLWRKGLERCCGVDIVFNLRTLLWERWFVKPDQFNMKPRQTLYQPGSLVVVAVQSVFKRSFAQVSISGFCFSYARTWYT